MAQYGKDVLNFCAQRAVKIPRSETRQNFTIYVIEVTLGVYTWTVSHRYSEFHDLHEKLVSNNHLEKNLLPPKKLFGNQSEVFIKKRQHELQIYLQSIISIFSSKIPATLAFFLDFDKYEIHGITQVLAEELYHRGDSLLQGQETFHVTPLQLHALTQRLKLPEPTCDSGDVKKDIGHILDFITRVYTLQISGTTELVGTSNINMNALKFDLTLFKSIKTLHLINCNHQMIQGIATIKQTTESLYVHHSVTVLEKILSQEMAFWQPERSSLLASYWMLLTHLDLSYNTIKALDDSVQLIPHVKDLNLSNNQLENICHLHRLSNLCNLDLSYNSITHLDSLHTKIGNLTSLNLAGNKIETVQGFSKMFSLQTLNLSNNQISQLNEVKHICKLPCLANLMLIGNPVVIVQDYRMKVLEMFEERTHEVMLDGVFTTQEELDTVSVLQAIAKARELKLKNATKKMAMDEPIVSFDEHKTEDVTLDDITSCQNFQSNSYHTNFRSTIESMRTQGGDDWLSLFNRTHKLTPHLNLLPSESFDQSRQPPVKLYSKAHIIKQSIQPMFISAVTQNYSSDSSDHDSCVIAHELKLTPDVTEDNQGAITPPSVSDSRDSTEPSERRIKNVEDLKFASNVGSAGEFIPHYGLKTKASCHLHISEERNTSMKFQSQPEDGSLMFVDPISLPNLNNKSFDSSLRIRLLPSLEGFAPTGFSSEERILTTVWCTKIQQTDPSNRTPACVTLTNRHCFIQNLTSFDCCGLPDLETFYIIPVYSIHRIIIGYNWSYAVLQESFVGPSGTFTLIAVDNETLKDFVSSICDTIKSIGNADDFTSDTDVIDLSQNGLQHFISHIKDKDSLLSEVNVLFSSLCEVDGSLCRILLTDTVLFIFRVNCLVYSEPMTQKTSDDERGMELLHSYKIFSKISEIQTYNLSTKLLGLDDSNARSVNIDIKFQEYGISMLFHDDDNVHGEQNVVDICFRSENARSCFLETLTEVRSDYAEKLSPTRREDPEGCTESTVTSSGSFSVQSTKDLAGVLEHLDGHEEQFSIKPHSNDDLLSTGSDTISNTENQIPSQNPTVRIFSSLELTYPSKHLVDKLSKYLTSYSLLQDIPDQTKIFANMNPHDFLDFFHSQLAFIGFPSEEVRFVLWTNVIPYTNALQELLSFLVITTKAVYFISSDKIKPAIKKPTWQKHSRNKSDFKFNLDTVISPDQHNSSGILLNQRRFNRLLKPYKVLALKDVRQLNFGLFDQYMRITGPDEGNVFTLVTRDAKVTDQLRKHFIDLLGVLTASPAPEVDKSPDYDVHGLFKRREKFSEFHDMNIVGKTSFKYPSEELLTDWSYVIQNALPVSARTHPVDPKFYVLAYYYQGPYMENVIAKSESKALILTDRYICICSEDLVSYPIPEFARGLPTNQQQVVLHVRKIEFLKRITVCGEHGLSLVFCGESDELIIDTTLEHFSQRSSEHGRMSPPEVVWTLLIQSSADVAKCMHLLSQFWEDANDGASLMVHVFDMDLLEEM